MRIGGLEGQAKYMTGTLFWMRLTVHLIFKLRWKIFFSQVLRAQHKILDTSIILFLP